MKQDIVYEEIKWNSIATTSKHWGAALSDNQNSEYLWKNLESGFKEIAL